MVIRKVEAHSRRVEDALPGLEISILSHEAGIGGVDDVFVMVAVFVSIMK